MCFTELTVTMAANITAKVLFFTAVPKKAVVKGSSIATRLIKLQMVSNFL
jgi:hypothetical protein